MKNNKPRYLIIDFEDYEAQRVEEMKLDKIADNILEKNLNAFKRLAEWNGFLLITFSNYMKKWYKGLGVHLV